MAAMASRVTAKASLPDIDYPTSDGKPMGETDLHRNVMVAAIETLKRTSWKSTGTKSRWLSIFCSIPGPST